MLDVIEAKLVEMAECYNTGAVNESIYGTMLRGALIELPMLESPGHIRVLESLKKWKELRLLPAELHGELQKAVMGAAHPQKAPTPPPPPQPPSPDPSLLSPPPPPPKLTSPVQPPVFSAAPARSANGQFTHNTHKKRGREAGQLTLFQALPDAKRYLFRANQCVAEPGADVEMLEMASFPSEQRQVDLCQPAKRFTCTKCPRTFGSRVGLSNHMLWHPSTTRDRVVQEAAPCESEPAPYLSLAFDLCPVTGPGQWLTLSLCLDGQPVEDILANSAALARASAEREARLAQEKTRRRQMRDAAAAAAEEDGRRGSNRRGSYIPKQKLALLEIYDKIRNDDTILRKVEAWVAEKRVGGAPYTTVCKWAQPTERAKICAAAGKVH